VILANNEVEEVTSKALSSGGLLTKIYFDMESAKQEELQPLMVDLINNRLMKAPGVIYCFGAIDEPMKVKDAFSTSATVTVLFKDLWSLVNVMFAFTPAGVEVLKPQKEYFLKMSDLQALLLNVAQISLEYSNYILSRVLKKEDYDKIMEQMSNREALGKKLLDSKGEPRPVAKK
jgi:hypothetical protein